MSSVSDSVALTEMGTGEQEGAGPVVDLLKVIEERGLVVIAA
jgi:hypothetical protein